MLLVIPVLPLLQLCAAAAAGEPAAPFSLELEFKKPTLLPNRLELTGGAAFAKDAAAGANMLQFGGDHTCRPQQQAGSSRAAERCLVFCRNSGSLSFFRRY
jgi:hypothetical protein